jgi:hypothetical protein
MAKGGRSGCLRAALGCVLGGIAGVVLAIVIAAIDAPKVDPADPLEFEWYTPFVLFILPIYGLVFGAMIGVFAALGCRRAGGKAWAWGIGGLLAGLAVGWYSAADRGEAGALLFHLILTCVLTVGGLLLACEFTGKRRLPIDEI